MTNERDATGELSSDTERLTGLGRLLRSTSLDELPELFNVLKGEMSIVGPRPLLMRYYPYFTEKERLRFTVRPGMTGLAQISGRNDLNWDQRLAADVRYVQELSFALDLRIMIFTLFRTIDRRGLRIDPGATMLDFDEERRRRLEKSS
jgi:lipopolysaccharide/colanic/teichoic acid biosynthesis glycosyltransferase